MLPIAVLLPATLLAASPPGEEIVRQMHARYAGKWYTTLTFVQTTSYPDRPAETWYEAGAIPGKLRIDIAPIDSGRAFMFVGDSVFVFRGGQRIGAHADRNLLLTLGFDVYGQRPETTIAQLRAAGIDLSKSHETTWQGKPVYVVGAGAGDTTSTQFWVEKERLLFVRLIEKQQNPNDPSAPPSRVDIEFNKYRPLEGGWIAPEVIIRRDGREIMREEYADVRANVTLPADLYDTRTYRKPGWVSAK